MQQSPQVKQQRDAKIHSCSRHSTTPNSWRLVHHSRVWQSSQSKLYNFRFLHWRPPPTTVDAHACATASGGPPHFKLYQQLSGPFAAMIPPAVHQNLHRAPIFRPVSFTRPVPFVKRRTCSPGTEPPRLREPRRGSNAKLGDNSPGMWCSCEELKERPRRRCPATARPGGRQPRHSRTPRCRA